VTRVLVVEDDVDIVEPLTRMLQTEGYSVASVEDGTTAITRITQTNPDLVILDLGLPEVDGLDVCRTVRDRGSDVPILILTARTSELDLVVGLDAGADDYLFKPFRSSELLARVRALLRRKSGSLTGEVFTFGDLVVDMNARTCRLKDKELGLTPTEFDVLALLMSNSGQMMSRQQILRDIWNTEWAGSTKSLDMHVSSLRRKLGDAGNLVSTVRGHGYRFDGA
jgi:DNA-binding response OmpR family regulator